MCQEERQVLTVASEGTVTAVASQLCYQDLRYRRLRVDRIAENWSVEFIWHRLLSVSGRVFLKITRTTEHCRSYQCQNRNLPERKVGLFLTSIHQAKVEKKEN